MGLTYRFEKLPTTAPRQVLIDVSVIVHNDARTGIQRVVRALLGQITKSEIPGVLIQPVFASRDHGYCKAVLMPDGQIINTSCSKRGRQPVVARPNDVFLGLDLCAHLLPHVEADLARWRRDGVSINIVVYDLLPICRPDWFSSRLVRDFRRWLGVVARQSDRCICISGEVARTLTEQLSARNVAPLPTILTIPLGWDLASSFPNAGLPEDVSQLRNWVQGHRTVLAVGTVEPRKGYDQLLDAFDHLWRSEPEDDIALLIVGRAGWRTGHLQQRIRGHRENGKRLIWLDRVSDELLSELYQNCAGLIAASHQEGFGLPLIEAAAHGAPILARDLPVFREVGGNLFDYFDDDDPVPLAKRIRTWLARPRPPSRESIEALPRWRDSAKALQGHLDLAQLSSASTS